MCNIRLNDLLDAHWSLVRLVPSNSSYVISSTIPPASSIHGAQATPLSLVLTNSCWIRASCPLSTAQSSPAAENILTRSRLLLLLFDLTPPCQSGAVPPPLLPLSKAALISVRLTTSRHRGSQRQKIGCMWLESAVAEHSLGPE